MSLEIHHKLLFLLLLVKGFNCLYDEGPQFTEEPPSRVEFINDLGIRLNCSVKGRPNPSIRWTWSDGGSLVEVPGLRYFSSSDGSLVFPPFSAEAFRPDVHSSTYRCIASNSVGTIVSRDVQLRAVVKEQFEARVESQGGTRGFPTVLECVINPKYMRDYVLVTSWVRDKSYNILPGSLESDNKYHILADGKLLIWQLNSQDSLPTYQCRVLHRLTGQTVVSSPGKIFIDDVEGPTRPEIRFRTPSIIVKENERVILPCIATGLPKPSFRWFKKEGNRLISVIDETSLEEVRSWDSHQSSSSDPQPPPTTNVLSSPGLMRIRHGALTITSVKVSHKGMYLCNASNSEGSEYQETELVVRSPLTVSIHPEKLTVDLGKNAEFTCTASGEPPPSSIVWLKDGTILRTGSSAGRVRFLSQNRIVVSGVVREDQGIYQCVVKNDYETGQQAAQLRLGDAYPQFIYRFIEQTLQPGPAISLKCSATGNPTPKVSWLLDGFPLPQSDRFLIGQYANVYGDVISHVNITSVRVEDGGEYECSFQNRAGKTAHAARLNIYGAPFVRSMDDILATAGQRLTIKCPVGGYPVDIIIWERDGMKLPLNDRQSVSSNGTLSVEPVERSDGGTYTCLAENKQGSTSQRPVNVKVMVPPKITPFTFATDLHEGERINIQCVVVKGDLPLTITWLKDSQSLVNPTNVISTSHGHGHGLHSHNKLSNNNIHTKMVRGEPKVSMRQLDDFSSVLSISSLESGHSGNYTCQAKNNAATAIHTSTLLVNVPPRISPFSFDDGLTEGMRTQVMCNTIAGDEPINMTWLKNSREVHRGEDAGIQVNYFSPFSTILSIPNITSSHSGNYSCIVSNQVGQVVHTAQLIVTVPAKWVVEPGDQSVSVGSHVAIHCQAHGFPKPTIKWKQAVGGPDKKEFREVGYRTPGVMGAENGTLIISRVTEDHETHYLCLANNGVGPGLSKLIRLTVNAAPRIRSRPQKEMVRRGETVRLRCEAEGDEPIRISWVAKGISLNDTKDSRFATIRHPGSGGGGSSPSVSELTIRDINLDDRGDFECIAVNAFGQDSFRISLLVQERPGVPKNFRLVEHTSRTVVLSWSLPSSEQDANVLDYIVWFKEGTENWSEQTNKKSTSGDQSSLIISGLSPATTYEFRLYARNQLGMSDSTDILQVTTDGEPPGGPPTHVSVESVSSTELRLSWQPPSKEYRHGHILGYNIGLKKARDEKDGYNWTKVENNAQESSTSTVLSTTLVGLDKFTEYEVVISAYNEQGQGPSTQSFVVVTLEDVPSAPPPDVSCTSPTPHSLSVSWQPPAKKYLNGIIISYKVVLDSLDYDADLGYHPFGTGVGTEMESRVNGLTTTFHGLSPFNNFSVQVGAATAVGDGILSQPISCRTVESVPDPPAGLKALGSSADSFIVSWLSPKNANGRILKYHLYMRVQESGSGREIRTLKRTVPSSTRSYEVAELKRREAYEVWITAETEVGEGTPSSSVNFGAPASSAIPAAIISFGKVLAIPWKTDAFMPCMSVGSPKPIVNWKKRETKTIDPSSNPKYEIGNKDNVLRIKSVQRTDSGNYTCFVRNPSGSDHIVYMLLVQVPPTAPLLHATAVTSNSVRLQWKQGDNGGSAIRGFILNFRPTDGEWEEITLSRKLSTYQVGSLRCGQTYEFFLSALNKVGSGLPSETVKVTSKGGKPVVPNGSQILYPSHNGVRLNLSPWDGLDCPAVLFIIEYKAKSSGGAWHSVRHEVGQPSRSFDNKVIQINELTPETDYVLRIRAVNGAGSSQAEYEISTSVFKGGLTSSSSKFNVSTNGGGPSSSSSSSSSSSDSGDVPFYRDMHIILPLIISVIAVILASATVLIWLRKKKLSEGVTESTNSLSFRRDLQEGGGGRGGIDYMPDRNYTMIRAKLMPDCDYIPENSDDIYPYATFHLAEKENLAENIPEGFLGPPSSQRLSNPETIPIRQISRGGHNVHQQRRNKSRLSNNMSGRGGGGGGGGGGGPCGGESSAGESDEYDDSCGSDSEAHHGDLRLMNDNNSSMSSTINRMKLGNCGLGSGGGGGLYSTNTRGSTLFRNDETLLVSDRKSLSRGGGRSKFVYGYSSNHPRLSGPVGYSFPFAGGGGGGGGNTMNGGGGTIDRRGLISGGQDETSCGGTATTSFIFAPPPTSHIMELNQMPVDCDNRINTANPGLRNSILGGGRFMSNSQQPLPPANPPPPLGLLGGGLLGCGGGGGNGNGGGNPSKLANSINNIKTPNSKGGSHVVNHLHSDYTIAV